MISKDEILARVLAGPCSAESEQQVLDTARGLRAGGVQWFRAGIWKLRTRPGNFEGVGSEGLAWLVRVQKELGMKVCTEVTSVQHARECIAAGLDGVWLGARTTTNPSLVQEIAETLAGAPLRVFVKNPLTPDLQLWIGAVERLQRAGVKDIILIHRGFSAAEKMHYRNNPYWRLAAGMREAFPGLPMYSDPSHISGRAELVPEVAQLALDLGFDGLMVECHCNPSVALSDAAQQLTPEAFFEMLDRLTSHPVASENKTLNVDLGECRARIDALDEELLHVLAQRMEVSRQIGEIKKSAGIAVIQNKRWGEVLGRVTSKGADYGLSEDFVRDLWCRIHDESVIEQNPYIEYENKI